MLRTEWQKILIEHGYFARAVPKEYGGYGGEADMLKAELLQQNSQNLRLLHQWEAKE